VTDGLAPHTLLVDGHVHFHECFSWPAFVDAAAANFARARRVQGMTDDVPGCLLFADSAGTPHWQHFARHHEALLPPGWSAERGDDIGSIVLGRRGRQDTIVMIAGRQVVTAERLEVLAVGCREEFADGRPIRDVLRAVVDQGWLAVVPWGFGKWWGRRGRLVRRLIADVDAVPFCLGDNGGRAAVGPRPALFAHGERRGRPVLGGSDPLPLPHQVVRPASYGFILAGCRITSRPAEAIAARIRLLRASPPAFGGLSSLPMLCRAQLGLRWRAGLGRAHRDAPADRAGGSSAREA
jgi:hypothetical protein